MPEKEPKVFHRYAKANEVHASNQEEIKEPQNESVPPKKKKWWIRAIIKIIRVVLACIFVLLANHILTVLK